MLVPLSDPTWFAPVINYVKSIAEHMKSDQNNYLVLLIITDGGIEGTIDLHFLIFISNEHCIILDSKIYMYIYHD